MSELLIKRIFQDDFVTLGVLFFDSLPQFVTLEPPWKENKHNVSCIPIGSYNVERVRSPKFGDTISVMAVPDRSYIRFHSGNDASDTEGCPLVGMSFDCRNGHKMIVDSGFAMRRLREFFGNEKSFKLRIIAA